MEEILDLTWKDMKLTKHNRERGKGSSRHAESSDTWNSMGYLGNYVLVYKEHSREQQQMELERQGLQSHVEEYVLETKGNEKPLKDDKKGEWCDRICIRELPLWQLWREWTEGIRLTQTRGIIWQIPEIYQENDVQGLKDTCSTKVKE